MSAMPKGEFSPVRNADLVSPTPSPSASRSSVMRLGLGTPAPAKSMAILITPGRDAGLRRLRRRVRLGDEQVAIGKHIKPARMIEALRKGVYREPRCGQRL